MAAAAAHDQLTCYLVGGAVRDALLDREVTDRDWVVVGATVTQMLALGFTQVGRDFPVFLHPESKEEYALARTERKTAAGHTGFAVFADEHVALEEDLQRRDLTINALARDESGDLIDPFGGLKDLRAGCLRHVSDAFAEDPLRILRVARFAAQLPGFTVAPETLALMTRMCGDGELCTLSAERIWQEWRKALASPNPQRFVEILEQCGGMQDWFPELVSARQRMTPVADNLPKPGSAMARFVWLALPDHDLLTLSARLKIPRDFLQAALDWLQCRAVLGDWLQQPAEALSGALVQLRVTHGQQRLQRLVDFGAVPERADELLALSQAFGTVKLPADNALEGPEFGRALEAHRVAWLDKALKQARRNQPPDS